MCLIPYTRYASRMFSLAVHVGIRVPDARADRRGAELSADHVHRPGGRHRREDDRRRVVDCLSGLRDNRSVVYMWFTDLPSIRGYTSSAGVDRAPYAKFAAALLSQGIRVIPGGRWYVSCSHTDDDVDRTLAAVDRALAEFVRAPGHRPGPL